MDPLVSTSFGKHQKLKGIFSMNAMLILSSGLNVFLIGVLGIAILKMRQGKTLFDSGLQNCKFLLEKRTLVICEEITDQLAKFILTGLLYLESKDGHAPIKLYINSPGGSVTAGLAIFDGIRQITCDVETMCVGQASGMAALILASGARGKRRCTQNARAIILQPATLFHAAWDETHQKEIGRLHEKLGQIFSDLTGQSPADLFSDDGVDRILNANEAKENGFVDVVIPNSGRGWRRSSL